jgi:subtilisin family serine protease
MACPVVAGIAALVLEYYPTLTAQQLKSIIEKSAVVAKTDVNIPGTSNKISLAELSRTGAVANAYEAIKMAASMTVTAPKVTLQKKKSYYHLIN